MEEHTQDQLIKVHRELKLWNQAYTEWMLPLILMVGPPDIAWDEKYVEKNGVGSFRKIGPIYPEWFMHEKLPHDLRLECAYLAIFIQNEMHPIHMGVNPYKWKSLVRKMFLIWEMETYTLSARKEYREHFQELDDIFDTATDLVTTGKPTLRRVDPRPPEDYLKEVQDSISFLNESDYQEWLEQFEEE